MAHSLTIPLTLLALHGWSLATAQELAPALRLDGWVDGGFVGGRLVSDRDLPAGSHGSTDFTTRGGLRLGWDVGERVAVTTTLRTDGGRPGDPATGLIAADTHEQITVAEAYASVRTTETMVLSAGRSYGPIGWQAREPSGMFTVTPAITTAYYGALPTGMWAAWTPSEALTVTGLVADGLANGAGSHGKARPVGTHIAPGGPYASDGSLPGEAPGQATLAPALDLEWRPTPLLTLDLEAYLDPRAGDVDADGRHGPVWQLGVNGLYAVERFFAGGEIIHHVVGNGNTVAVDAAARPITESQHSTAWTGMVAYAITRDAVPMTLAMQIGQERRGEYMGSGSQCLTTKGQVCLLTNPFGSRDFGLNGEIFAVRRRYGADYGTNYSTGDLAAENGLGLALQALFVLR